MLFSQISSVAILPLFAILAAAYPGGGGSPPVTKTVTIPASPTATEPASQCNTGSIQCCDSTTTAGSAAGAAALGLLGVVVQDLNVLLGLNCSPISVIGAGGNSCSASPVCCEDNSFGTLISIGCVPIDLSL